MGEFYAIASVSTVPASFKGETLISKSNQFGKFPTNTKGSWTMKKGKILADKITLHLFYDKLN